MTHIALVPEGSPFYRQIHELLAVSLSFLYNYQTSPILLQNAYVKLLPYGPRSIRKGNAILFQYAMLKGVVQV